MHGYRKDPLRIIAPEGLVLIAIGLLGVLAGVMLKLEAAAGGFAALTLFFIYFFRDPRRNIRTDARIILCPADGRILSVEQVREPPLAGAEAHKVSIFMSPLNVHVNRAPVDAKVTGRHRNGKKFLAANKPASSAENIQVVLTLSDSAGRTIILKQIVGAIARRIVCHPQVGDDVTQGQRIGIIRFGSRVEIFLPDPVRIGVSPGEKVRAGETVIGEWL